MHVMSRSQASPIIEELVTRATYQSPLARRSSRLSSGNDLLSGGRMDESMEMALKEQDEEESEGEEAKPINGSHGDTSTDDDDPLVWLEQREEPELTGPGEDADEVVQEEDEAPVASPVNKTASPVSCDTIEHRSPELPGLTLQTIRPGHPSDTVSGIPHSTAAEACCPSSAD
jgi:hypothetical protein